MIKLYDFALSGHAHKVRMMLGFLGLAYESHEVDLAGGEQRSSAFSRLNPFQHVPVLVDDGLVVRDSNAIIAYLARKYGPEWYPADAESVAAIQEWLAIATKELFEGPAAARMVTLFGAAFDHDNAIAKGHALLTRIEKHLHKRDWIAVQHVSIADIALYSYIAHAPEGGVSLSNYPRIRAWLGRIEDLPYFVGMTRSAEFTKQQN